MDILSRTITNSDFLGKKHSSTFKNQSRVQTCLGGLLSIAFCLVVSVGIFFLGRELYERKTPLSNLSEAREAINEINLDEIQVLFSVADKDGKLLNSNSDFLSSVDIIAFLLRFGTDENNDFRAEIIKIPLIECSAATISQNNYETLVLDNKIPEMYLCLDKSKAFYLENRKEFTEPFLIRNKELSIGSSMLGIQVNKCNSEHRPDCKDALTDSHYNVHLASKANYLDISSFDDPIKSTFQEFHDRIVPGEERKITVTYKINELHTDTGYIFSSDQSLQYFTVESAVTDSSKFLDANGRLFTAYFDVSMMRSVVNRKYLKIQELLATVGGFIKAMMIILGLILKTHCKVTLLNAINKEKYIIEAKLNATRNSPIINNFTEDKTISNILAKNSKETFRKISFSAYLKAILLFPSTKSTRNYIKSSFTYFDISTTISLVSKVKALEATITKLRFDVNKN